MLVLIVLVCRQGRVHSLARGYCPPAGGPDSVWAQQHGLEVPLADGYGVGKEDFTVLPADEKTTVGACLCVCVYACVCTGNNVSATLNRNRLYGVCF